MLEQTAINLDTVNLSPALEGNNAAKISVNRLDVDDSTVTVAASVCDKANWKV